MITETSKEAYKNIINEENTQSLREIILQIINNNNGITDKEGSESLGIPINVYVARRNELSNDDLIIRSNRRRCSVTNMTVDTWITKINNTKDKDIYIMEEETKLSFGELESVKKSVKKLLSRGNSFQIETIKKLLSN